MGIRKYVTIITLTINDLNSPTKKYRLGGRVN
jgi:hypothetical protein